MNGGPTSPRELEYFLCDVVKCSAHITDEDDLAPSCEHPGCRNWTLCIGCAYDCVDCQQTVCVEHVCETPLPQHSAIYRCCRCQNFSEQFPGLYALSVAADLLSERAA